jgi:hypothetical protein
LAVILKILKLLRFSQLNADTSDLVLNELKRAMILQLKVVYLITNELEQQEYKVQNEFEELSDYI